MANVPSAPAVYALTVLDQAATPDTKTAPNAMTLVSVAGVPTIVTSSGNQIVIGSGGGGGSGTVTSVGLNDASGTPIYAISNSPVTGSGTLTLTLASQAANTIFAGPASGGNAQPTFRAQVAADVPALDASKTATGTFAAARLPIFQASGASHAIGAVPDAGATAGTTRFLREDATWVVPSAGGGATGLASSLTISQQTTSGYQLTSSDTGKLFSDWNSTVAITLLLPSNPSIGDTYWFNSKSQSLAMKIQQTNASHQMYSPVFTTTAGTTHGATYTNGGRSGPGVIAFTYLVTNVWLWSGGYPYDWNAY